MQNKVYVFGFTSGVNFKVSSKEGVINKTLRMSRTTHYSAIDGECSQQVQCMEIEEFECIFSSEDIVIMMKNGHLDYYPKGYQWSEGKVTKSVGDKYPAFKKEIYQVYGIPKKERYDIFE